MSGREKDKKLRRRKRRRKKIRRLKRQLSEANGSAERQKLIEKLTRFSRYLPEGWLRQLE